MNPTYMLDEAQRYLRSRWFAEAIAEAAHRPKVIRARQRMRSGGLRERVRYWHALSCALNRPAYLAWKLAPILGNLPPGKPEHVVAYAKLPTPFLFFESADIMASIAALCGWDPTR